MPSSKSPKFQFGIRAKLYTLILISFIILIGVTLWRINVTANQSALQAVEQSLLQSSVILETKMDSRFSSIQETTFSLARDGRVLPFVFDGDSATLQDLTQEFQRALEFDILIITSASGEILARSDRPEAIGFQLAGRSALFDTALQGKVARGIFLSQGRLLQIVSVPVLDNIAKDVVRGTISVAYALSSEMAQEINKLTASDVGFYTFERNREGQITGVTQSYSTAPASVSAPLVAHLNKLEVDWQAFEMDHKQLLIEIKDQDYYALLLPLERHGGGVLGFVLALRSQTELLQPYITIQQQVLIVGLLGLVVASVLAGLIALNISRPLLKLVSVTEDIEQGRLPDKTKYKRNNDETGVLYDALFRMGKSIQEKNELENYLAQLAQEIDTSSNISERLSMEAVLTEELPIGERKTKLAEQTQLYNDTGLPTARPPKIPKDDQAPKDNPVSKDHQPGEAASIGSQDTVISDGPPIKPGEGNVESAGAGVGEFLQTDLVINERYKIIRLLGVGAVGQVYLAKDLTLNENLALKILNQQTFDESLIPYFKAEIRLARRITHRNILRTFDFGIWQGFYYITMEYVEGHDLETIIYRKGPLDLSIGIVMAKQICSALLAAHEQGIIHRDLKPANMMVNKQGILKIMDFGLAMQIETTADGSSSAKNKVNVVAGTPKFMAPEQFEAGELDERTDIYAVGAIFYTLFAGRPPFESADMDDLCRLHLNAPPPKLSDKIQSAPKLLDGIIDKAMAKQKQNRYASVRDMLSALQSL